MPAQLIASSHALENFCRRLPASAWLGLDTEFMRESTYYPRLCVLQVSAATASACIDVLAVDTLQPLLDLLKQKSQLKIFHSCRQDLEALYAGFGFLPAPLFDTQIAASILGLDEQISYAQLVAQKLSIQLAKSERRTDWQRRPLSQAQIAYALDDVIHLGALYNILQADLERLARCHWMTEECEKLLAVSQYSVTPGNAWKQVRGIGKLPDKALYFVRQLAAWREQSAQTKNLPRRWILPDNAIVALARLDTFSTRSILQCLKTVAPKSQRHCKAISAILQRPAPLQAMAETTALPDRRLSKAQQALIKKMMRFINRRAKEINTSASLLANRKSLVDLVSGRKSKVVSGWRKAQIGDELIIMLNSES